MKNLSKLLVFREVGGLPDKHKKSGKISDSCLGIGFLLTIVIFSLSCGGGGNPSQPFELTPETSPGFDNNDYFEIREINGPVVFSSKNEDIGDGNRKKYKFSSTRMKSRLKFGPQIKTNLNINKSYTVTSFRNGAEFLKTVVLPSQLRNSLGPDSYPFFLDAGEMNALTTYFAVKSEGLQDLDTNNAEGKIRDYFDTIFETETTNFENLTFSNFSSGAIRFNDTYKFHKNKINILSAYLKIIDSYKTLDASQVLALDKIYKSIPISASSTELRNSFSSTLPPFPDSSNKGKTLINDLEKKKLLFEGTHIIGTNQLSDIFWNPDVVVFFDAPFYRGLEVAIEETTTTTNQNVSSSSGQTTIPNVTNNNYGSMLFVDQDGKLVWGDVDLSGRNVTELADVSDAGSGKIITDQERTELNTAYGWGDHSEIGYSTSSISGNITNLVDTGRLSSIDCLILITSGNIFGSLISPNVNMKMNYIEFYTEDSTKSNIDLGIYDFSLKLLSSGNIETNSTGFLKVIQNKTIDLVAGEKYYFVFRTSVDRKIGEMSNLLGFREIKTFRWKKEYTQDFGDLIFSNLATSKRNLWVRGGFE